MARQSKVCHSARCGGTKQPVSLEFVPNGASASYRATCDTCGTEHPPDSQELVGDAKAWERKLRARYGRRIPLPLPQLKGR